MQDEGQQAGEGGDVWNKGWRKKEKKTVPRMVGQHQGVWWRRNSHTQQEGRHEENGGADGIGHLRALSSWSNGWMVSVLGILSFADVSWTPDCPSLKFWNQLRFSTTWCH